MPNNLSLRPALTVVLFALAAGAGCRRAPPGDVPPSPAQERLRASLQLVPGDARIVAWLDLERLRGTSVGRELAAGPVRELAALANGLAQGLAIDPVEQVRQALLAVPGERQEDGRFIAILRIDRLDRARAAAWLAERRDGTFAGVVRPPDQVMLARGAWATALAASGPSTPSAADDPELLRLCERAAGEHPVWLAAIVPTSLRRHLIAEARFPDVASLLRVRLAVDVDRELRAELVGELSNQPDATSLAARLKTYVDAAKRHPDMLAQGLAPYLEALRLQAQGPNLHASLSLAAGQAGELGPLLRDLLRPSVATPAKSR